MRELYHFDIDTAIHPNVIYTINAVVSSPSDSDPNAVIAPRPVTCYSATRPPIDNNTYVVSNSVSKVTYDSLVDRGANGGVAGSDMRLINYDMDRTIDVQGIDNHQVPNLRLGKFGAVAKTKTGNVSHFFLNVPAEAIRRTYDAATRYYRAILSPNHIKQLHRSAYPACNAIIDVTKLSLSLRILYSLTQLLWGDGRAHNSSLVSRHVISAYTDARAMDSSSPHSKMRSGSGELWMRSSVTELKPRSVMPFNRSLGLTLLRIDNPSHIRRTRTMRNGVTKT